MSMITVDHMDPNTLNDILYLASEARGKITKVYAHWTAGWYGQTYTDYHICIDQDGKLYLMCDTFEERKAHTWHRNSHAVGIALMCCADANARSGYNCSFGSAPPTLAQIDTLAQVTAVLARGLGLPLDASHFLTHCEAAIEDDYGPGSGDTDTRWDLWYLPDFSKSDPMGYRVLGGHDWRKRAKEYFQKFYG